MGLLGRKAVATGEAPAPRGYYRGPLPLPGRQPVSLTSYRGAALRASKIKHRDQARDKYVLARNRRAQVLAGTVTPQLPAPEAIPAPLALPAPPVYVDQYPQVLDYGVAPIDYGVAPIYSGAVAPYTEPVVVGQEPFYSPAIATPSFGYVDATAGLYGAAPAFGTVYPSAFPTTGFVGY